MAEMRFLLVRLGSLGDIVHALPAAAALRDGFPETQIDWLVEPKWRRILEGNRDLNDVIALDRGNLGAIWKTVKALRSREYSCAIDFQGLYKSALIPFFARIPRRIGFRESYAREGLASRFYTERVNPTGAHKVDHNLTLARAAGAKLGSARFPLLITPEDRAAAYRELASRDVSDYFVLNPGGGWKSKCWPAERYGQLGARLHLAHRWRSVVTYGPGEEAMAQQVIASSGGSCVAIPLALGPLMAMLERAKFVVSADTGPLHVASALGAPCVGLFGPTDPARNGPYSGDDVTVRDLRVAETTYRRGASYASSMLSITVEHVAAAVEERLRRIS
ncbi:MAG: glycosyltransferase family 9 protein [Candidatus Acidiferrales bacterium]